MIVVMMTVLLCCSARAFGGVTWQVTSISNTTVPAGGTLDYLVQLYNTGDTFTDGKDVTLTARLPSGLSAVSASVGNLSLVCNVAVQTVTCVGPAFVAGHGSRSLQIVAAADPSATGVQTTVFDLEGGGASFAAHTSDPVRISAVEPGFGIDAFDGLVLDASGEGVRQAGGHPDVLTTSIDFNAHTDPSPVIGSGRPVEDVKDLRVDLPPGLVGSVAGLGECTIPELANGSGATDIVPLCPATSQVGITSVRTNIGDLGFVPVFNMAPPAGVPARFGFDVYGNIVVLDTEVIRTESGYGLSVRAVNLPQGLAINGNTLTLWGIPSDASHDAERSCPGSGSPSLGGRTCSSGAARRAFLRSPTSCSGGAGLPMTVTVDSWQHPGDFKQAMFLSHDPPGYPLASLDWGSQQGLQGCEKVPFTPVLRSEPLAGAKEGAPAAFAFDVTIPQSDDPIAIAQSDLKKAVVTLPQGVRVNPSSADGLGGCSPAQVALSSETEPDCPDASKLGTMEIDSPLLDTPLTGSVYLARPFDNPFGSLLAVYLVASAKGAVIKVPGEIATDPSTGQITATFDDNPQLPFSRVHMVLDGGPRAPLTMPSTCGSHRTQAVLTGWNAKVVNTTSTFNVSGDGHGAPCADPRFAPGFTAGTQNPVAGDFTPFGLRLTRTDDDGEFGSLSSLSLPKGLLANVASIKTRCTIEQADTHACPADSHIGEVTTGAGAGSNPFYVSGDVYLTGPYKGNPFGVAVIVHALAGPFDLGYVVVKGAIQIHDDGSVTVATDPFPTILQGIPLQVRDIRVNLDRPGFMFNPTSCSPMSIDGMVVSTANQQAGVSSRFQVGECASLAFKPKFTASTSGKTSKANGASFHVHLASNEGPHSTGGGESNIAKVDVQLPVSLPARLTTLQKACTAVQFASNPAGCPAASFVGTATAHTPILASPLSGPAILVSHGGQAFPDLVLVLQGEGVRLNITGHTQIKKGTTYSRFETVPDAPVSSFDLTLPQGPHSALTTDVPGRNLCATTRTVTVTKRVTRRVHGHTRRMSVKAKKAVAAPLLMPTTITAQNGAVLHQNTKIAVTGCIAAKAKAKAKQAKARSHKH